MRTGFLDAFTDLRSGRVHSNPAAVLAGVLAGATNLGLERMARASSGVSHAQLSWAHAWYLRPETYADALARIIDVHHALSFARVWGSAGRTSSDGQFFSSARNAGVINAKYGPDFLSGRYGSFHSNVIGATAGEAPFVLDGPRRQPRPSSTRSCTTSTPAVSQTTSSPCFTCSACRSRRACVTSRTDAPGVLRQTTSLRASSVQSRPGDGGRASGVVTGSNGCSRPSSWSQPCVSLGSRASRTTRPKHADRRC